MTKKTTWIAVIAAVVIIIIVAVIWLNTKTAKAPEVGTNDSTSTAQASSSTAGSSTSTAASSTSPGTASGPGSYATADFSVNYPAGWDVATYHPFALTTFGNNYLNGGILPPGGAEIDVVTTTAYSSEQTIMQTELINTKDLSVSVATVDGVPCAQAAFRSTYGPTVASDNIAVYCEKGTELWKIYFAYRADDVNGAAHAADFGNILGSLKLL